jgi:hypothetical protein
MLAIMALVGISFFSEFRNSQQVLESSKASISELNEIAKIQENPTIDKLLQTQTNIQEITEIPKTPEEVWQNSLQTIKNPAETQTEVETSLPKNSVLKIELFREAGFFDPFLAVISPVSKVFGIIEIDEKFLNKMAQFQIMEDNSTVGILQEFEMINSLEAAELYAQIKNLMQNSPTFELNETNGYGDQSLYLNHPINTNQVFIVIQSSNKVFAFTYLRILHPKFQDLFKLLN